MDRNLQPNREFRGHNSERPRILIDLNDLLLVLGRRLGGTVSLLWRGATTLLMLSE
jgi:hypothetical protein